MRLFQRGQRGTRVFYATDVHGSERTWKKFLNAAKFYGADVLVMGGDVMGKLAIPIIREFGGTWRATIHGRVERVSSEAEVDGLRRRIGDLGFYDVVMDEDEYRTTQADPAAIERLFVRLATDRLMRWMDLAETRLAGTGIKVYATGGNDDLTEVMATLDRPDARSFVACEDRAVPLDDEHVMVSMPYVNPTPWKTPREADETELATKIAAVIGDLGDHRNVIFNFHAPPKDSTLDTCPMLDATTDPPSQIVRGGQPVLYGAGSTAIRDAIERHQPLLGLHGHIHESQAAARLGRTLCVNPGSEYGEGVLRGCLITLRDGRVDAFQMTAG
ncbi:MAG TPA: metallophosphoesterase [Patescibacteria group bacterium]|jgi:Icc-related predicted phosphoesterase|nr:metallophosphoesterase [Patescibacteria group bacterium]